MKNQLESSPVSGDARQGGAQELIGAAAIETAPEGSVRLVGSCCSDCGLRAVPPADVCPGCGSEAVAREVQPEEGVVYSMTTLHVGPRKWAKPMTLGYVDLTNGVRVLAVLQGEGHAIGGAVRVSTGKVGEEADGAPLHNFVFVPKEARP